MNEKKNYILEYWNKINSGEIKTSEKIKKIYSRVVKELETPKPPYIFDIDKANKPIEFIEKFCYCYEGDFAGQTVKLLLWEKAFIQAVYGFVDAQGHRRYTEVLLVIGRKNGKSSLISCLGIYGMVEENGGSIICVANALWQAKKTIFEKALTMIKISPDLEKHFVKRKDDIYFEHNHSTFQPLPSNPRTIEGANCSAAFLDEIHEMSSNAVYDSLKLSRSMRQEPLLIMLTTAGFIRSGLYDNRYDYACKLLDGLIEDDNFICFIYELENEIQVDDESNWIIANPSLYEIKNILILRQNVLSAKNDPELRASVMTKDFNLIQTKIKSWLPWIVLNNNETFNIEDFRGSYGIGGADLAQCGDLCAGTFLLMKKNDPVKYILQHYWIPKLTALEKERTDRVTYSKFVQEGICSYSGENKVNYSDITNWFLYIMKDFGIIPFWIGYDDWNSGYWVDEMKSHRFNMVPIRQGYKSESPTLQDMSAEFRDKHINYNNNNLTRLCLYNTEIETDSAGNIKFTKQNQKQYKKIDGTASMYDAYKVLLDNWQYYQNIIK